MDQKLIVPINNDIPAAEAGFLEPVSTVVQGIHKVGVKPMQDVVVIGGGTMGLVNAQVAKAFGARVIVSDISQKKIKRAQEMGVDVVPWVLLVLLAFSALCAVVYSRYITCPIVRLSGIAGKMAELDFGWICGETRRDEIGVLGRSLDRMSQRLSAALTDLRAANDALLGEMERERELERQRSAFFAAASHELKTPVTILKGQLTGMLDEVGVYRDRDRYLARSLQVTSRMEALVGEILTISRMESGTGLRKEEVDLSRLVEEQLEQDRELLDQREMDLSLSLAPGLVLRGDPSLLGRAVDNLLSNAALYSPAGARIRVRTLRLDGRPTLVVENTGVQIGAEALLRLFEPFYREEQSRNRRTGGSGLGLYLVKMILDRHGARCEIENITDGVRARVIFPPETAS